MKLMDKLIVNKKVFIFLLTIALIGVITGSIFVLVISRSESNKIISEVNNFINNLNQINYLESFKNVFLTNIFLLIIIWLVGISIIGIPISLFLYFIKCFSLGFTISSFIMAYNVKGILISVTYVFPTQIMNIFVLTYLLIFSLIISFKLLECLIKKQTFNFNFIKGYKKILIISITIFLISNLYETYIVPILIKLVLQLIK